jgi:iron complex outermembrane receptor protein
VEPGRFSLEISANPMKSPQKHYGLCIACGAAVIFSSIHLHADTNALDHSTSELKRLSLEQLMDIDVTSVTRTEQKLSESAAAIQVITQEDIRRMGALSIPAALRYSEGLEVARVNSHDWAISSRGFNSTVGNKLQVLMDGRTLYSPLYSGVFWDVQDTFIEDIDRIEVIRGPGASLWGANAVNGIINVVTKSAKESQGTVLTGGAGTEERGFGGVRYGGKISDNAYFRVYGKYFNRDDTVFANGADAGDAWDMGVGGFRMDWNPTDVSTLTLQGDLYSGNLNNNQVVLSPVAPFATPTRETTDVKGGNILGRWTRIFSAESDLKIQAYYDRTHRGIPQLFAENRDTFNVDLQHRFPMGERHDFLWGIGYDATRDDIENSYSIAWYPDRRFTQVISAFVQDEITLVPDRLRLTLGSKFDHNDFTGFEIQPNARLSWQMTPKQTFWGAVSRAVRRPTRFDRDLQLRTPLGAPFPQPGQAIFQGNPDFDSETVIANELGYRAQLHPRVSLDIATFYNLYEDLRSYELQTPSTSGGLFQLPVLLGNRLYGETYGVETGVRYQPNDWWRLVAGYTFLAKHLHTDSGSTDPTGGTIEANDPDHQFYVRSLMDLPGHVELDTSIRYVDELTTSVPGYLLLEVRIGWSPTPNWEFSVAGQNLMDNQHPEFGSYEIEQSVYGKVTMRF